MSSIRSVVLPMRNGFRYRSTAGFTRSARCVNVAQPYPYRPSWSVVILTTVSRTPAGAHSITLMSLIFGMDIPRVALAACSWACSRRGLARPSSPAVPMAFKRWRRCIPYHSPKRAISQGGGYGFPTLVIANCESKTWPWRPADSALCLHLAAGLLLGVGNNPGDDVGVVVDRKKKSPVLCNAGLPEVSGLVVLLGVERRVELVGCQKPNLLVKRLSDVRLEVVVVRFRTVGMLPLHRERVFCLMLVL